MSFAILIDLAYPNFEKIDLALFIHIQNEQKNSLSRKKFCIPNLKFYNQIDAIEECNCLTIF